MAVLQQVFVPYYLLCGQIGDVLIQNELVVEPKIQELLVVVDSMFQRNQNFSAEVIQKGFSPQIDRHLRHHQQTVGRLHPKDM